MQNIEFFTKKTGKKVVIGVADWPDAKRLQAAILREVKTFDFGTIKQVTDFARAFAAIDSSPDVDAALWPCLGKCLYDDQRITPVTFNTTEARGDYYEIVYACIKENLGPLVESLFSVLPEGLSKALKSQKSPA